MSTRIAVDLFHFDSGFSPENTLIVIPENFVVSVPRDDKDYIVLMQAGFLQASQMKTLIEAFCIETDKVRFMQTF